MPKAEDNLGNVGLNTRRIDHSQRIGLTATPSVMYLIHLLLPLRYNQRRPHGRELFRAVAGELTERIGGLTAHTRAPAESLWKGDAAGTTKDEIVIYEVMTPELDEGWWQEYRRGLGARFQQEHLVVRAQEIQLL